MRGGFAKCFRSHPCFAFEHFSEITGTLKTAGVRDIQYLHVGMGEEQCSGTVYADAEDKMGQCLLHRLFEQGTEIFPGKPGMRGEFI